MLCGFCEKPILVPNLKGRKFCSSRCRQQNATAERKKQNPHIGSVSRNHLGAASEMVVAADLLRRGYPVFRSMTHQSPFDLVVMVGSKLYRVEVKTGYKDRNGRIYSGHTFEKALVGRFDVLAEVVGAEVAYKPRLESLTSSGTK